MGLLAELKRRNVIRVAGLYVIVSWLLLQVSDVVLPLLGVPDWGLRLILFLLAIGFVLTVVFSWVYEMTPEGLKKEHEVDRSQSITSETGSKVTAMTFGALLVAIALMLYQQFGPTPEAGSDQLTQAEPDSTPVVQEATIPSIAVLPFADMSPDQDQEYFSDGISEELLNLLAKVDQFKVAGRTSSFAFKGKEDDLRVIGGKLNVGAILEGSVRKAGNKIRITAQLVNVEDGFHLWSETYDRTLDDVFAVQDEIANAVVSALKETLLGDDSGSSIATEKIVNPAAYELYLKGRFQMHKRSPESLALAEHHFGQAIAADPGFALAYSGLSDTLQLQEQYAGLDHNEAERRGETAVRRALQLDPESADVWASLGLLKYGSGDPEELREARQALEKAIEINPNHAMAHMWMANAHSFSEPAKSLALDRKAHEIDPLHPTIMANLINRLRRFGRFDEAIALAQEYGALYPENGRGQVMLGDTHFSAGRLDQALIEYQGGYRDAPERFFNLRSIPFTLILLGELDLADDWLRVAEQISPDDFILMFNRAEIERQRHGMEQYVAVYEQYSEKWQTRLNEGFLGSAHLFSQDFSAAKMALETNLLDEGQEGVVVDRDNFGFVDPYASTLMGLGELEQAVELAEQVLAIYQQLRMEGVVYIFGAPVDLGIAKMQSILGQKSEALQALHSAYESGYRDYQNLQLDPTFDPIREDLGFTTLIQKMQSDVTEQRQHLADTGHLLTAEQVLAMEP